MKLKLRALEPSDLDIMYDIENDKSLWVYSNTSSPFSKHTLKKFIEKSHLDILEHRQVRLVIYDDCTSYGFIDLFDYDHISRKAGVGIVIFERFRSKGIGSLSLKLIEEHVLSHVPIHQLYANISSNNIESISLSSYTLVAVLSSTTLCGPRTVILSTSTSLVSAIRVIPPN